ncbi:helix-turn-helix domain-containing protein [Pseudomonas rhizosphaerae]|jgi:DNA-binding XRE family transcriptional regulator|uniref:Cro/Cl family transcriptional regulator n=1 Tax=Pseudomonas rhizosphaerae TaxID=216142 RepID=A0A089YN24_9PSED|nr:helix-turn-helix transcriptional regulator [Pseudomonas rhizosphaerae]AIS16939.1 Cro/Cl family transcriptional regulator [Pseudomonas rhizosphaerae]MEB2869106.1 helix-turn-helix transcriptional regulator [Pseudomonas rhizosphaerae]
MGVQVISRDGQPEYAVLPWAEYQRLLAAAAADPFEASRAGHMAVDQQSVADPATAAAQVPPPAFARLRELREAQGLPLESLARAVGISPSYLSMIETGERQPDAAIRRSLAWELGVPAWSDAS